jgi:subtilisin family serine protease
MAMKLNARALWTRGFKGNGVKVAVLDSGLGPEGRGAGTTIGALQERSDWTADAQDGHDSFGHGSFVASVIGATRRGRGGHHAPLRATLIYSYRESLHGRQ